MSFLIISVADLHLDLHEKHGQVNQDGLSSRLLDKLDKLSVAVDYAVKNKADLFVSLGDNFERVNPPEVLRTLFIRAVNPLIKASIPVVLVKGNHDFDGSEFYSLRSVAEFRGSSGLSFVEDVEVQTLLNGDDILPVAFVGWDRDVGVMRSRLNGLKDGNVLFMHAAVEGAVVGRHEFQPREGLKLNELERFACVQLGHYHKRQFLKDTFDSGAPIFYVGSLCRKDFGEADEPKGFCVARFEEGRFAEVSFYGSDRSFVTIKGSENNDSGEIELEQADAKAINGSVVRVRILGSSKFLALIDVTEIRRRMLDAGAFSVTVERRSTDAPGSGEISPPEAVSLQKRLDAIVAEKDKGKKFLKYGYGILERSQ